VIGLSHGGTVHFLRKEVARMGILFMLMDVIIQNAGYITDVINWLIARLDKTEPPQ
jgi:hypothetical protein